MKPLRINDERAKDLAVIADLTSAQLSRLRDEVEAISGVPRQSDLKKIFAFVLPADTADVALNNIAAFSLLRDEGPHTSADVLHALIAGCREGGYEELSDKLELKVAELEPLVSAGSIYRAVKSTKLFAADTLHLHEVAVYVDSRPLFDPRRDEIDALLLYASLHIVASDASENESSLRVSLRRKDLDRIIDQCERAKKKLDSMQASFAVLSRIEVIQYGTS